MMSLRQVKQAGKLRTKTDLEPVMWNVTRWSSTFEMLKRFFLLEEFIDKTDESLAANMPTHVELIALKAVMKDLEQFERYFTFALVPNCIFSTTKSLQDPERTLSEVRSIFDKMLEHYPTMARHISKWRDCPFS
jgi:hypothetical protein